jgi:hypothetical protein
MRIVDSSRTHVIECIGISLEALDRHRTVEVVSNAFHRLSDMVALVSDKLSHIVYAAMATHVQDATKYRMPWDVPLAERGNVFVWSRPSKVRLAGERDHFHRVHKIVDELFTLRDEHHRTFSTVYFIAKVHGEPVKQPAATDCYIISEPATITCLAHKGFKK